MPAIDPDFQPAPRKLRPVAWLVERPLESELRGGNGGTITVDNTREKATESKINTVKIHYY